MSGLEQCLINSLAPTKVGKIIAISGDRITVSGIDVCVGSVATVDDSDLECVGFKDGYSFFVSIGKQSRIQAGDLVYVSDKAGGQTIPRDISGEVLDCYGNSLISKTNPDDKIKLPDLQKKTNPLSRPSISIPMDVGVRTINTFTSIGVGQRIGIMAGTGVGKSTLIGMISKFTNADAVIINLVGERSREVNDFIRDNLTEESRKRTTIVVSTADETPMEKIKSADLAISIAEKLKNEGKNVLLMMDSMTRYANAYRDVMISAGEIPANRGFPASVFSKIYDIVERSGNFENGSITSIYTILLDADNVNDPVADHCRGIMDGHIVLSRDMANSGIFPAIDISRSISRVMPSITMKDHQDKSRFVKSVYNTYNENKDLISMGYEPGTDKSIDISIKYIDRIKGILTQDSSERSTLASSLSNLREVYNEITQENKQDP